MADKKKCFIIMPITTPEYMVENYSGGKNHFKYVLETLFVPCVEAANYTAIRPQAKGSVIIHASFIKHLEESDLVLCDISTLNPNVFFEFGIRTSLDKPIAIVKDELTPEPPFDTGLLHHHEYASSLHGWTIEDQKKRLTKHILDTEEENKNQNSMWKLLGMQSSAKMFHPEPGDESQIELLRMQIDVLTSKFDSFDGNKYSKHKPDIKYDSAFPAKIQRALQFNVDQLALNVEITVKDVFHVEDNQFAVIFDSKMDRSTRLIVKQAFDFVAKQFNIVLISAQI